MHAITLVNLNINLLAFHATIVITSLTAVKTMLTGPNSITIHLRVLILMQPHEEARVNTTDFRCCPVKMKARSEAMGAPSQCNSAVMVKFSVVRLGYGTHENCFKRAATT
jgi:hypothetical protein